MSDTRCFRPLLVLALAVVVALGVVFAAPADSQSPEELDAELIDENPLIRDAATYAAGHEVEIEEALRRLELQDFVGNFEAELTAMEREGFAGVWIQHEPEYRVIVSFTCRDSESP